MVILKTLCEIYLIEQTNLLHQDISKTILELQASVSNIGEIQKPSEKPSFVRAKPHSTGNTKPASAHDSNEIDIPPPPLDILPPSSAPPSTETKPVLHSVSGMMPSKYKPNFYRMEIRYYNYPC